MGSPILTYIIKDFPQGSPFGRIGSLYLVIEHQGPVVEFSVLNNYPGILHMVELRKLLSSRFYAFKQRCCEEIDNLIEEVKIDEDARLIGIKYNESLIEEVRLCQTLAMRGGK